MREKERGSEVCRKYVCVSFYLSICTVQNSQRHNVKGERVTLKNDIDYEKANNQKPLNEQQHNE